MPIFQGSFALETLNENREMKPKSQHDVPVNNSNYWYPQLRF